MIEYCIKMVFQFIEDMKKQKLRSILTMSGITWGTMAVLLLLSFGESFRKATLKNMTGMGTNIVIMGGGQTSLLYKGMPPGRSIQLREEYVQLMKKEISEIGNMSPEIQRDITLTLVKNGRTISASASILNMAYCVICKHSQAAGLSTG